MKIDATDFAKEWIAAWNAHDLEAILSHYAPEIVFLSPFAQQLIGNGRIEGIVALRSYWKAGLAALPNLKFELEAALVGHQSLTILYRNHRQQQVAETVEFNTDGKVIRSCACYSQ